LGRWLSVDRSSTRYPDISAYVYTNNNSIIYIDFDGNDIVFFDADGYEQYRIKSNETFKSFVAVPNASSFDLDFAQVANDVNNNPSKSGWMEAPMPGIIKGFEDPVYQQNDYLIAAKVAVFNWKKNNDPASLPTCTGPTKHQLKNNANMPVDLDPTLIKAMEIQESGGTVRNGEYNGDVMTVNYPGDWEKTKDMKRCLGLTQGIAIDPRTSIDVAINILYLKGLKSDSKGNLEWRDANGAWSDAVKNYNGGGTANYQSSVLNRYANAKVGTKSNYVNAETSAPVNKSAPTQLPKNKSVSQCDN